MQENDGKAERETATIGGYEFNAERLEHARSVNTIAPGAELCEIQLGVPNDGSNECFEEVLDLFICCPLGAVEEIALRLAAIADEYRIQWPNLNAKPSADSPETIEQAFLNGAGPDELQAIGLRSELEPIIASLRELVGNTTEGRKLIRIMLEFTAKVDGLLNKKVAAERAVTRSGGERE